MLFTKLCIFIDKPIKIANLGIPANLLKRMNKFKIVLLFLSF